MNPHAKADSADDDPKQCERSVPPDEKASTWIKQGEGQVKLQVSSPFNFENIKEKTCERITQPFCAYCLSNLCNLLNFTNLVFG